MNRADLDPTDRRILDALQADGTLSAAEVAARVGATATTCWRRIRELEKSGVIRARVALLDRAALGLDVTIFAHVKLASQGRDALARFEQAIRDHPCVLECYTVMGEWDFLLHIVAHDIKEYEAFYLDHLSRIPLVQSVNSTMVVTALKKTTVLPLEHLTYLVTGVLMWWPVWQGAPRALSSQLRAAYVFAAFVISAPVGLLLALTPSVLYDAYADAPSRLWGLSRIDYDGTRRHGNPLKHHFYKGTAVERCLEPC